MYLSILQDERVHTLLWEMDREAAAEAREGGCLLCRGVLHQARYPRKPRGGPAGLPAEEEKRESFCCAKEGCRKRRTPPSLRFLERKVYRGTVVVLVAAMRHGATPERMRKLREVVGVSARTVERWRKWWRTVFVASPIWRAMSGRLVPAVEEQALPLSLLERFAGDAQERLVSLLRFISTPGGSGAQVI